MNKRKVVLELFRDHMEAAKTEEVVARLDSLGFFEAPASAHHHGAYEGGLFDHSYAVTKELLDLTDRLELKWQRSISPVVVGIFHDLCKCDLYRKAEDGKWEYNPDADYRHGEKSVEIAQEILPLTEEEIQCIRWHMGAYTQEEDWYPLNDAIKEYSNVLWSHTADMVASQLRGI